MKFNKTLDNKRIFTRPDGEKVVDLTQQTFSPNGDIVIYDVFKITKDFEMRPDLVAKAAYSSVDSVELVLKQGGISNPFTIQEGDFFFLQDLRAVENQFANSSKEEAKKIVRNQYIDSTKAPEVDDNLKKFDKRNKPKKADAKKSGPALPPNFANVGDKEIKLKGGKVIYGEDVTNNKDVCDEAPLSKSEFLSRLIKNRLSGNTNNP